MKIMRLELENFGKFNKSVFNFQSGVNIVYGSNEAGKSTLQEAVQVVLFGFGKTPKQYGFKAWHQDVLRIKASLMGDDDECFEVERLLSKTTETRIMRGLISESLGNEALPELHHLNKTLYKQVYGLNTANTSEFQKLDWTGMIRNMLQTSGTELLIPTDKVLAELEDEGNRWLRLNGRGHYELKTLETEGHELESLRRELLRQRDEVSDLIVKEQLVAKQLKALSEEKRLLGTSLSQREVFLTPWMMMGSEVQIESLNKVIGQDYEDPIKALEWMNQIGELQQRVSIKEQEIMGLQQNITDEWYALLGSDHKPDTEHLQVLSTDRGEQGVMLARQGRMLKNKSKDLPKVRALVGLLLMMVGGVGALLLIKTHQNTMMPLVMAVMVVGLWFAVEGALLHKTSGLKLKTLTAELERLFEGRLPQNALDTLDESFFERLNRLSKECGRQSNQYLELKSIKLAMQTILIELDRCSTNQIHHQVSTLSAQKEALQKYLQQREQYEEASARLQKALAKAEAETGLTMEAILEKLGIEGVASLPQSVERMRQKREELGQRERDLCSQQAVLLKEIELRSQLEELPNVEAAIAINQEERMALKLKRDRISVFESFIRTLEGDYNKAHQPELIRNAAERFMHISGEKYNRLYLEEGTVAKSERPIETSLQVEGDGGVYRLDQLTSTGTREQLFMALKLSIASQMEVGRESLPLMLDEVFSHWDYERTSKCLEMLAKEAEKRQIVVFTCHKHLAELVAEKTGGQLIELR